MCDENTASKILAFSTAKQNGVSGENIICTHGSVATVLALWLY
jgi:hypothetical protein